jgi:hypothetical protein
MRCHQFLTDRCGWKKNLIYNKGVTTKEESIAPRADLSAWCYSLPPVDAGGLAALGWRSCAGVTTVAAAVLVAFIVSAVASGGAAVLFGFFVILVDIF